MISLIKRMLICTNTNIYMQFFRYAVVGGIATVADISVYHIGIDSFNMDYKAAKTLSFIVGLFVNYFLSRRWVFNKQKNQFARDFFLFSLVGVLGLGLSILILYGLIELGILRTLLPLSNQVILKDIANMISIFLVLFWNFIVRKRLVFDEK